MIEANLEMTHDCIFFLLISSSFVDSKVTINTLVRIFVLVCFVIWPIFLIFFLSFNKEKIQAKNLE